MNDFTKEELKMIYWNLPLQTPERESPQIYSLLMLKIKSMIDNYCEHEWRQGQHLFNDVFCTKCNKSFPVSTE